MHFLTFWKLYFVSLPWAKQRWHCQDLGLAWLNGVDMSVAEYGYLASCAEDEADLYSVRMSLRGVDSNIKQRSCQLCAERLG